MKLDLLNQRYFDLLSSKESKHSSPYKIAASAKAESGATAYSTAIAPKELLQKLPTTAYESLGDPAYIGLAKKATVIRKKMFAGIGSSIERRTHLQKHRKNSSGELGAKGTDLYIPIVHPKDPSRKAMVSFAEVQLLQGILAAEKKSFKKVVFEDLVSSETKKSLEEVWDLPCLLDPTRTYREYVASHASLSVGKTIVQANLPTLTEEGKPSLNRLAPGGHGFFGFEILQNLLSISKIEENTLSFLSNGEDLSAQPDAQVIGWMMEQKIPICMVVTEKTEIDKKGGQLATVVEPGGETYVTLIETAQAKAGGQLPLFEELGLSIKTGHQVAYFNTNLALFNESLLKEKIGALREKVGDQALWEALTPDVIHNWKEQVDKDGVKRKYLQLEGAMGSVLLNLDRLSRKVTGETLVHFLLISKAERSRFFAPVKTAFDLFLQYYSDKYSWDAERLCPINREPGRFPTVKLETDDVETVLSKFRNADLSSYFL